MNKLTIFIIFVFGTVLSIGLSACGVESGESAKAEPVQTQQDPRGTSVGQLAPEFELTKTDGTPITLKDLEGNPAMIVFWTAWCPVCKEEAPHVNKIFEEFGPKGLNVVGINIGESEARVNEGIKEFGIKYTVAKDTSTDVAKSYKVVGTPTVVILDSKGTVNYFGNEIPKDYRERLEKLLGA
jgi:peroxiredoxin